MVYNANLALNLVKDRLNRMRASTQQDEYLYMRIEAAAQRLKENGITLRDTTSDLMLLVDMTVWEYQNRDKPGAMPDWLRQVRRDRFLADRKAGEEADTPCC